MKKFKNLIKDHSIIKYDNPSAYNLDHDKAETIWKALMDSNNIYEAQLLSKLMIDQGCDGINIENPELILLFWKEYLEENNILCLMPDEKLH